MRGVNNSVETVNAAAAAIVAAESRAQQVTVPRRRWAAWLSVYWCFGSHRNENRINHAVLVPEPAFPRSDTPAIENPNNPPEVRLPFIAPPSSPASFLPSGTPSAMQSPVAPISLSALSTNTYSPSGPTSIFAIGPYANEPQLVSPPIFSTFTTEPSTAPLTPPPEPLHLTTPSSPEVPFAKLLTSSFDANCKKAEAYEFPSYQLYPGSPIGRLISPSSACSGPSSPFPDPDYHSADISFQSFPIGEPPKILSAEGVAARKLIPRHARIGGSLLDGNISAAAPAVESAVPPKNNEYGIDHRVSFDLTAEEFTRCLEKKVAISSEGTSETFTSRTDGALVTDEANSNTRIDIDDTYHDLTEKVQSSLNLPPTKEFNFDNSDGTSDALTAEEFTRCLEKKVAISSEGTSETFTSRTDGALVTDKADNNRRIDIDDTYHDLTEKVQSSLNLHPTKEFNFDNSDGISDAPSAGSDWWANEKVIGTASEHRNSWAFMPMIQPGVS